MSGISLRNYQNWAKKRAEHGQLATMNLYRQSLQTPSPLPPPPLPPPPSPLPQDKFEKECTQLKSAYDRLCTIFNDRTLLNTIFTELYNQLLEKHQKPPNNVVFLQGQQQTRSGFDEDKRVFLEVYHNTLLPIFLDNPIQLNSRFQELSVQLLKKYSLAGGSRRKSCRKSRRHRSRHARKTRRT